MAVLNSPKINRLAAMSSATTDVCPDRIMKIPVMTRSTALKLAIETRYRFIRFAVPSDHCGGRAPGSAVVRSRAMVKVRSRGASRSLGSVGMIHFSQASVLKRVKICLGLCMHLRCKRRVCKLNEP